MRKNSSGNIHFITLVCWPILLTGCDQILQAAEVERALRDHGLTNSSDHSVLNPARKPITESHSSTKDTTSHLWPSIDRLRTLARSHSGIRETELALRDWQRVIEHPDSNISDKIDFAEVLIQGSRWEDAEAVIRELPPTDESFKRYRIEALLADNKKDWRKADAYYKEATNIKGNQATAYNNWGYSKLTRGLLLEAEELFSKALSINPSLSAAKHNLVIARALQKKYDLPLIEMSQTEKAELLYTIALSAIKQGDTETGKALLREAIFVHPQYFESAVHSLATLGG